MSIIFDDPEQLVRQIHEDRRCAARHAALLAIARGSRTSPPVLARLRMAVAVLLIRLGHALAPAGAGPGRAPDPRRIRQPRAGVP